VKPTVTLVDPQGKNVEVPQEQVIPLMRSGFGARSGQTVTLADAAGTEIPIESLAEGLSKGERLRLQSSETIFKKGAEERFGGAAGLGAGLAYGALQGASLGTGGRALIESGLVNPDTLAQLESARGGGLFSTVGAGEALGGLGLAALTGGFGAGAAAEGAAARTLGQQMLRGAGREALIGAGYGAGSELTQAGIEGREANLLPAAAGGAVLGGALGAAGEGLVGKAASLKAKGAKAAADKAAEEAARAGQAAALGGVMEPGVKASKGWTISETVAKPIEMRWRIWQQNRAFDSIERIRKAAERSNSPEVKAIYDWVNAAPNAATVAARTYIAAKKSPEILQSIQEEGQGKKNDE